MSEVTIYHNPRCSKSRQTLELIRAQGVEPEVIEYLKAPPSASKLGDLLKALGKEPLEVIRTKEGAFKDLGLTKQDERSREEWIQLMVKNPVLIERPIVVKGRQAVLGRPPENVLELI